MRTLATVCLAFSAGIFAAQYVLPQQWLLPLAAACGVLALAAQLALKEKKRLRAVLKHVFGGAVLFQDLEHHLR